MKTSIFKIPELKEKCLRFPPVDDNSDLSHVKFADSLGFDAG
jgi:hypothetical protein